MASSPSAIQLHACLRLGPLLRTVNRSPRHHRRESDEPALRWSFSRRVASVQRNASLSPLPLIKTGRPTNHKLTVANPPDRESAANMSFLDFPRKTPSPETAPPHKCSRASPA